MDSYREGDLVTVKGEILDSQRGSVFLGGRSTGRSLRDRIGREEQPSLSPDWARGIACRGACIW
jgi:hypothetical protein